MEKNVTLFSNAYQPVCCVLGVKCGSQGRQHSDGLVQERRNSNALAMELRLSCTNPSTCCVGTTISTFPGRLNHFDKQKNICTFSFIFQH